MTTSQQNSNASISKMVGLARSVETVSLELIRNIDETVAALDNRTREMSRLTRMIEETTQELSTMKVIEGQYFDESDVLVNGMEESAKVFNEYLTKLVRKRAAIDKDGRLKDHHCEALHDAYETAMTATAALVDALHAARATIITHDLAAEPRGNTEVFATVDDLISSLRNQ